MILAGLVKLDTLVATYRSGAILTSSVLHGQRVSVGGRPINN